MFLYCPLIKNLFMRNDLDKKQQQQSHSIIKTHLNLLPIHSFEFNSTHKLLFSRNINDNLSRSLSLAYDYYCTFIFFCWYASAMIAYKNNCMHIHTFMRERALFCISAVICNINRGQMTRLSRYLHGCLINKFPST